jgi:hypothetical protein
LPELVKKNGSDPEQRITYCIGSFCRTENTLCESGFEDLIERRKRKIIEMVLHVAEETKHPMNQHLENQRAYNQYAGRPKLTKPFLL